MIAVDTNLLAYAHRVDSPFHQAAFERMAELAEGPATWATPWPCLHEFLAIVTHPRIYMPPTPLFRRVNGCEPITQERIAVIRRPDNCRLMTHLPEPDSESIYGEAQSLLRCIAVMESPHAST